MFYNARWYDPALGRFTQPDTIIPQSQGTQGYDRYAYVNNNPLRYTDPSGHGVDCGIGMGCVKDNSNALVKSSPASGGDDQNAKKGKDDGIFIPFDTDIVGILPGTSDEWANIALNIDEATLVYDLILGMYVLTWVARGAVFGLMFEGNPVIGLPGAVAGFIIGEGTIFASRALIPGNIAASVATLFGLVSDMKSGKTSVQGSVSITPEGVNISASGHISTGTMNSIALTAGGLAAPLTTLSLPMQTAAVANDRGWIPTMSIPVNINLSYP